MCGIVGLVAFAASTEACRAIVQRMADRIWHRGPDGGGVVAAPDATLGMTRLAIVDVDHGHQPMLSDDGSVVLVFNGEIYNAPALRTELEQEGVRFRTRSDTEVLLRLYERNPERVEELLAGMWAFAIHDRTRRRVVLSRDRFGIKPLFVSDRGDALAFGSELRCFDRDLSGFGPAFEVDHAAAHAMLSWSFVPEDRTIFTGVRRLSPGTRLEVDLETGARVTRRYWTLAPSPTARAVRSLDEAAAKVEAALRRSVREHLMSDVPVATLLSGGIDSSLITALAAEESNAPIRAFSIGFREPRFDESDAARTAAARCGVSLDVAFFDEHSIRRRLADALLAYDEPFGDSSCLAVELLSEHVARTHKVALGGDGGDEVFAGYRKYKILSARERLAVAPRVRDGIGRALARLPRHLDRTRGWTELLRTAQRISQGLVGTDAEAYVSLTQVAPLTRTAPLVRRGGEGAKYFVDALRQRYESAAGSALGRTLETDLSNTLVNDMLVKVDRASMARHLEVRVPFLDHRLVELGLGLPARFTLGGGGKAVLRAIHERRFGRELARRKKKGFGVPIEKWLRGPLAPACERLFASERLQRFDVLASETLGGGRHREWVAREPILAWHAFALAVWCEANLGDGPAAVRELLTG